MSSPRRAHIIVTFLASVIVACTLAPQLAAVEFSSGPLLIQGASIHKDQIAFSCGGRIWLVARSGGTAEQLTRAAGNDVLPVFSPDGAQIAFLRRSERVMDMYVRRLDETQDRRVTYHPARDFPVGWTPDSKQLLFNSNREGDERLYTIPSDGTFPAPVALPIAYVGCFSPDAKRMAYVPQAHNYQFSDYRYYRGGRCSPLWIVDLDTGAIDRVTDDRSNARDPMWIGTRIYFLSDRDGVFNLWVHDLDTKQTCKLTTFEQFGARGAASDDKSIVLVMDGGLQVFDVATEALEPLSVQMPVDRAALRPRTTNALQWIQSFALARDGSQAVICARGDAFLVNCTTGEAKNLTRTSGVAEREASLSPDGRRLAYFGDASGEYALCVRELSEGAAEVTLPIESPGSFYRELSWSPDSRLVAFTDKRRAVWLANLASREVKQIDRSTSSAQDLFYPDWHPGGRYLAYAKYDANRLPSIVVFDVNTGDSHAVTSGDIHATCPVFDKLGRFLYFLSSSNAASADFGWGVLAGVFSSPLVVKHLNVAVLREGDPAPVVGKQPNLAINWRAGVASAPIDFSGIGQRIVSLDASALAFAQLEAGPPGVIYALVDEWPVAPGAAEVTSRALYRLDLRSPVELKKVVPVLESFSVSQDGRVTLCKQATNWIHLEFQGAKPTLRPIAVSALPAPLDPAREWKQMFHESWRLMRDFFYDPAHHGHDWDAIERHYAEFLSSVGTREELNVLLRRMLGYVAVSHLRVGGGDIPAGLNEAEEVGLLGADMDVSQGLYRFKRVLASAHFDAADPLARAPLDQPGANVAAGEYLLAIDEQPIDATKNLYAMLRGKASRPTRLRVSRTADHSGTRTVTVVPVADETMLRISDVAERNARVVQELSGGRLGYFRVASYTGPGLQAFLRGYFANRSKAGLIVDQRSNGGGITPDFFVELLSRRATYYYLFRDGDDLGVPVNSRLAGPTVLLINEDNGSAAETCALMFRLGKLGPLVGKRTSGGVIGPYGFMPPLVDGGRIQIPSRAAFDPAGKWIENDGVHPDVEVDILPVDWRAGRDPQLEAAVRVALEVLEAEKPAPKERPAFPRHP